MDVLEFFFMRRLYRGEGRESWGLVVLLSREKSDLELY